MNGWRDEFWPLVDCAEDAFPSAELAAQFEQTLTEDERARRLYLEHVQLQAEIFLLVRSRRTLDKTLERLDHLRAAPPARTLRVRLPVLVTTGLNALTQPLPFSLFFAALTMLSLGLFFAQIQLGEGDSSQPTVAEVSAPQLRPPVASLTGTAACTWGDADSAPTKHQALAAGRVLDLRDGLAEFTFANGVRLVLQGPAVLHLDQPDQAKLASGAAYVAVPYSARGFRLDAPELRVIDLGTEFAISVAPTNETEVHVFRGQVALEPLPAADHRFPRLTLVDGEAVVVTSGDAARLQRRVAEPARFVAALPGDEVLSPSQPEARVVVFQQGAPDPITGELYAGAEDVQLLQWGPDVNFGGRPDFDVGTLDGREVAHTLLRFDLSSLSGQAAVVHRAVLRLHIQHEVHFYPWASQGTVGVFPLAAANAAWAAGRTADSITPPTVRPGEATWNWCNHGTRRWAGSAGASTAGVDYDPTLLASCSYTPQTTGVLEFVLDPPALVEQWIRHPERNAGLFLRTAVQKTKNRICFHSSESETISLRPELVVEYATIRESAGQPQPAPLPKRSPTGLFPKD